MWVKSGAAGSVQRIRAISRDTGCRCAYGSHHARRTPPGPPTPVRFPLRAGTIRHGLSDTEWLPEPVFPARARAWHADRARGLVRTAFCRQFKAQALSCQKFTGQLASATVGRVTSPTRTIEPA